MTTEAKTTSKMPAIVLAALHAVTSKRADPLAAKIKFGITPDNVNHYVFRNLPDRGRQVIREAVVKAVRLNKRTNGGKSIMGIAAEFGVTGANVLKWLNEEAQGIHKIRGRGRPKGSVNLTDKQRAKVAKDAERERAKAIAALKKSDVPRRGRPLGSKNAVTVKRGRPLGSKNAPKVEAPKRGRPRKLAA